MFNVKIEDVMRHQRVEHPNLDVPYLLVVLKKLIIKMDGMYFNVDGR